MKNIFNRMKYLAVMLGFLNVLAMSSCKDEVGEMTVPVTGVSLNLAELKIQEGVEYQMTYIITPENATNKQVEWSVSDLSVEDCIAVDAKSGIITPKKPGTAVVTVTTVDGNFSASCNVEIVVEKIPVESITITEVYYIVKNESYTFEPAILPAAPTNNSLIWSLENVEPEGCLTIDESTGIITAGDQKGTATLNVVAADGRGAKASCTVHVVDAKVDATGITLDKESIDMQVGDEPVVLTATITPEDATQRILEWEVIDAEPAGCITVDKGIVTAVAEGKAKINVTIQGTSHSDECNVTVLPVTPESGYSIGEDGSWWIYNLDGLKAFRDEVSVTPNRNAKLVKDIDLGTDNWTPIGSESSPYKGVFDGNGKKISNLNILEAEKDGTYQGFFASLDEATVQNLGIESGSIDAAQYIGSIAGSMINSVIINCYNKAKVTGHGNSSSQEAKAGGIVGYCKDSQIIACYNEGEIGKSSVTATVTNCDMGGIVGNITGVSYIIASYNRGPITQTGGPRQGGIAGKLDASTKLYGVYNVGLTKKGGDAWGISGGGSYTGMDSGALYEVYWVKVDGSSATAGCKFTPDPSKKVETNEMNSFTVINAMNTAIQSSNNETAESYQFIAGSGDYPYPVLSKK